MAVKFQSKQIDRLLAAPLRLSGVSVAANASSVVVTSPLTTALATAGDGGVSVPLQVGSATAVGLLVSSPVNLGSVSSTTSGERISNATNNEVYGRLTHASGVYTFSFFTKEDNGTETAYTFASAATVDLTLNYVFDLHRVPFDALIRLNLTEVSQDPTVTLPAKIQSELLLPTALNTLPDLSKTPAPGQPIFLFINGMAVDAYGGSSAAFTNSGKTITLSASNLGFSVATTDRVVAMYYTFE